ncbi:hypothetical protein ABZ769_12230 [Streptomyces olivoreticuli]
METTQPTAEPTASEVVSRRVIVFRWLILLGTVALIGWAAITVHNFFQDMAGGPIRTAPEYRERDTKTRQAGRRAVAQLPSGVGNPDHFGEGPGSTSCVDDFGFDDTGVTRDQPTYKWSLSFSGRDAYLTQLKEIRTAWEHRGWKVHDVAPSDSGPGKNLPGITTTDRDGITITLAPDWYSGAPTLKTDGGCIRHQSDPDPYFMNEASDDTTPARTGSAAYSDKVKISAGPVRPFTPSAGASGYSPGKHAYRVAVTVTNESNYTLDMSEGHHWGSDDSNDNDEVKDPHLHSCPRKLPMGKTANCEFAFTTPNEVSQLRFSFSPSHYHKPASWNLTTK